jgi:hypothetical protein
VQPLPVAWQRSSAVVAGVQRERGPAGRHLRQAAAAAGQPRQAARTRLGNTPSAWQAAAAGRARAAGAAAAGARGRAAAAAQAAQTAGAAACRTE